MKDGVRSSWKGQSPLKLAPARLRLTKSLTTSTICAASSILSLVMRSIKTVERLWVIGYRLWVIGYGLSNRL